MAASSVSDTTIRASGHTRRVAPSSAPPWSWRRTCEGLRLYLVTALGDRYEVRVAEVSVIDLYLELQIGREEYVGRMRALEASLSGGLEQPSYFEADLVKIKGLLHDWMMLWDKAEPQERADIVGALFGKTMADHAKPTSHDHAVRATDAATVRPSILLVPYLGA